MLDRLLDVALLLRRQPREFAGEDFPRFGDVAVEGFGFMNPVSVTFFLFDSSAMLFCFKFNSEIFCRAASAWQDFFFSVFHLGIGKFKIILV